MYGRDYKDSSGEEYLPLYESKLIHHYDHRFATFEGCTRAEIASGYPRETRTEEHANFHYEMIPRYWIPRSLHASLLGKYTHDRKWLLVYRDVTGATNQRTAIATIIPLCPATRTLPALGLSKPEMMPFLLANVNSIAFDFLSRVKVSGMHLNFAILKQLPVIPPETYKSIPTKVRSRILECVIRLSCTSNSLRDFAVEHGFAGPPMKWDENERSNLMCELSAIYSHLYGLTRDELEYVLDTFTALRDAEVKSKGEFETKKLVLNYYDNYAGALEPVLIKREALLQ
jgi:hypothetical protein